MRDLTNPTVPSRDKDAAGGSSGGVPVGRLDRADREDAAARSARAEAELGAAVDAELQAFADAEKARLGIGDADQWTENFGAGFRAADRAHTTILVSGLTLSHDTFIVAGLRGLGYRVQALECPDTLALAYGKEFGSRGQCNPTWFTVGNLVKSLDLMRKGGMTTEEIIERYVFVTANACGPCRFGSYVTEYRKALRDAGFEGFRVILFQQTGGLDQMIDGDSGLVLNKPFFLRVLLAIVVGDVLNSISYRVRPYERVEGATDAAIERCRAMVVKTFETPGRLHELPLTLLRVRRELGQVAVDRTRIKPKVSMIGEFWAMTTEGDGNYKMPRFLEAEGAEVEVQTVTAWILYMLWEVSFDTRRRMGLNGEDGGPWGLKGVDARQRIATMWFADKAMRAVFQAIAHTMGLPGKELADMNELAEIAARHYHNENRGGEGHMEVAKLILNTVHSHVNMTLSVKPFGCLPSSGVSDGVQSIVTALHPNAIFLPIETTGDSAVNAYSRVQMMLFKARAQASAEVDAALERAGVDMDQVQGLIARHPWLGRALHQSRQGAGCTTANVAAEAGRWLRPLRGLRKLRGLVAARA